MKPAMKSLPPRTYGGFSLIEMIVAITVLGILSAAAAVFMRGPITGYFDAERRADLAEMGGLAMAKLSEEVARAVPNSVRITPVGAGFYLEFLPVHSEGRYRVGGPGNVLSFGAPGSKFDVLGPPVQASAGDWVVVNNYQAITGADVWAGPTRAAYGGATGLVSTVSYAPPHAFPADSPDHRFQLAGGPVTYVCDPASGTLRRYGGYAIQAAQPVNAAGAPLAGAQNDLLASGITACRAAQFPGNLRRAQVVALELHFDNAGDRLNLDHTLRVEPLP